MGENPYLRGLREEYRTLQASIAGLQQRAKDANRALTDEEMRSVVEMGEKGKALYNQIESLSEIELRNAKVEDMQARVISAQRDQAAQSANGVPADGEDHTRSQNLGGARTTDRDPGFYHLGSQHSYIADQYRAAQFGDEGAKDRLAKHTSAMRQLALQPTGGNGNGSGDTHLRDVLGAGASTFGAGLVPPVWLASEFAPILHRRLRAASVLRRIPWPGSPFAWSIPISGTAATGTVVAEGINPGETDPSYTVLTVTPKAISGYSEVSRQMLDASNPAVDSIIWGDLLGDFYDRVESEVIIALEAQASVNLVTVADGAVSTTARNGILDAIAAVSDNSAGDADVYISRGSRWVAHLKFVDTTGRPLILAQQYSPSNAIGLGDATQGFRSPIQGSLESLVVVTSPTVGASRGFVVNSQELLVSISPPMQFSFEQPAGPALVRVGVWGYEAVVTGRRPKAITKIQYSAN